MATAWQVAIRSSWKRGQGEPLANNVRKGSAVTVFCRDAAAFEALHRGWGGTLPFGRHEFHNTAGAGSSFVPRRRGAVLFTAVVRLCMLWHQFGSACLHELRMCEFPRRGSSRGCWRDLGAFVGPRRGEGMRGLWASGSRSAWHETRMQVGKELGGK